MSALPAPAREHYRPMTERDLDEVAALEVIVYAFPWTRANFADALSAGNSAWLLRDEAGALLSYAVVMPVLDEAHLLNLSVARERQGQGWGFRLLDWMAGVARDRGAASMLLEVRPSNTAALALYRRYGFETIGVRRGYYPAAHGREDAIVMRVAL